MTTRAPFLTRSHGGYYHRDLPPEDDVLTHVGPGTPCGEYLRRFWNPVVFLDELNDLPVRLRVMGEDLVVFNDRQGQVGALQLHCCHRGTSLEFGVVSERGLRCCYHGWLFDVDGRVLETPGEPANSTLKDRLYQGAYPTEVYHGIVFAYMGPPETKPPFPVFDTYVMPGYRARVGVRHEVPANWLQIKENCMDPAHLDFLHTIDGSQGFTTDLRNRADWEYMETPVGMVFVASRRAGDAIWVRMTDFIAPNIHQWSSTGDDVQRRRPVSRPYMTQWSVPVDDTHTMNFRVRHVKDDYPIEVDAEQVMEFGQDDARPYEERQRVPGDFDAQVGQRSIAIHALEHLATTDRGVIMARRMVREGIEDVLQGRDPKGVVRDATTPIPTYGNDTIVRNIPPAPTPEEDKLLQMEVGRKVATEYISDPTVLAQRGT